ncbi:FunK1 protein kinase [Xylaria venustula]|nr:FunK1 protein kinase [Xylaria venustula]
MVARSQNLVNVWLHSVVSLWLAMGKPSGSIAIIVNSRGEPATIPDEGGMLKEIDGHMHGPTSGFIKKYFGDFHYVHRDDTLEVQTPRGASSDCAVPPAPPPLPDDFPTWFSNYISLQLDGARGSWQIPSAEFSFPSADGGTPLLLATPISPAPDSEIQWDQCSSCRVVPPQPTRLFLHGFYILDFSTELWVFDRSGLYCSNVFDVQKDFIQFLSIILTYPRMTDEEIGMCSNFTTDEGGSYVGFDNGAMPSLEKLYLERYPFVSRECLVGTGTTCYRARTPDSAQWDYVVKLKWRCAKERSEHELLNLAQKKGVWGIGTANLRRGLRLGTQKSLNKTHACEGERSLGEHQQCYADDFFQCTEDVNDHFQNRILDCIVTSPIGRRLYTFQSRLELLQVLNEAIKCHRSLYYDAKILHHDISAGNIIMVDDQEEGKPKGMLIDLDTAIELPEEPETEAKKTGTRPFMAIGALKEESHTYRHDLESFLYVFLWIIVNRPFDSWSYGDWRTSAWYKYRDMAHDF